MQRLSVRFIPTQDQSLPQLQRYRLRERKQERTVTARGIKNLNRALRGG